MPPDDTDRLANSIETASAGLIGELKAVRDSVEEHRGGEGRFQAAARAADRDYSAGARPGPAASVSSLRSLRRISSPRSCS